MNDLDSEVIEGLLLNEGYEIGDLEEADIVIMITCCVRRTAEKRALGRLTQLNKWKKEKSGRKIIFGGCIAQKEKDNIKKNYPFVDYVVGTRDIYEISEILGKESGIYTEKINNNTPSFYKSTTYRRSKISAGINIIFGCNNFCTYCIVPYVRGREVSRPVDEILKEAEELIKNGTQEIILLGQNVNSYSYKGIDFPRLLSMVSQIVPQNRRIRFITSHPKDFGENLIKVMASYENICNSIHLPLQAGSNRILKLMNRKYTAEEYLEKINMLRSYIPNVAITTDLIVGFPGETEKDYQKTLEMVKKVRYDMAFMFLYNPRKGTKAATFKGQLPYEVKQKRLEKLILLQNEISYEENRKYLNKTLEVLITHTSKRYSDQVVGKSKEGKNVVLKGSKDMIGKIVRVKIKEAYTHTLKGIVEKNEYAQVI